jgi:hypothetical protein
VLCTHCLLHRKLVHPGREKLVADGPIHDCVVSVELGRSGVKVGGASVRHGRATVSVE